MVGSFAKRYAAARAADPAELEQAVLRVGMYFVLGVYYVAVSWDGRIEEVGLSRLFVSTSTQVVSLGVLAWILNMPGINHARRRFGVLMDFFALVFYMSTLGEAG